METILGGLFGQITRVKEAIQHQRRVLNIPEVALLHDGVLPERRPRCCSTVTGQKTRDSAAELAGPVF